MDYSSHHAQFRSSLNLCPMWIDIYCTLYRQFRQHSPLEFFFLLPFTMARMTVEGSYYGQFWGGSAHWSDRLGQTWSGQPNSASGHLLMCSLGSDESVNWLEQILCYNLYILNPMYVSLQTYVVIHFFLQLVQELHLFLLTPRPHPGPLGLSHPNYHTGNFTN